MRYRLLLSCCWFSYPSDSITLVPYNAVKYLSIQGIFSLQFIANDFKAFIKVKGMDHVRTSPTIGKYVDGPRPPLSNSAESAEKPPPTTVLHEPFPGSATSDDYAGSRGLVVSSRKRLISGRNNYPRLPMNKQAKTSHMAAISLVAFSLLAFSLTTSAGIKNGDAVLQEIEAQVTNLATHELEEILATQPNTVLIDVRTPREILLLGGTIDAPRSYNVPRGWLEFRVPELVPNADTPIVVYCGINQRSPLAAATLSAMGYTNVKNYADGFFVWRDEGLPVEAPDLALDSMLFSKPRKVADGVWSAIGATEPPSYENSGHNNNLSFVVTNEGVLVVNASDNYLLARALHAEITKVTDQPVKYVVLENGQGHAAMGIAYWKEQGAHVIAHEEAVQELQAHGEQILERVLRRSRDKGMGTRLVLPDETISDRKVIEMGGRRIELLRLGPAHSPGDISVWLPDKKVVIAGDIAFHQRLLPVFEHTDTAAWLETWDKFEALQAEVVVPGHGTPTNMGEVTKYTKGYLSFMREKIGALIENGGGLADVSTIDQSAYSHLDTYDELARLNASMIFRAMEFE